mmetsp:Transcript_42118/g.98809  ORF Transcript_42118/g.98809 Transcript_42118/m.98809 type:complete len:297 (+) Transcript_42118:34-924(+)
MAAVDLAALEKAKTQLEAAIWQELLVVPHTPEQHQRNNQREKTQLAEINLAIAQKKGDAVEMAEAKKDLAKAELMAALAAKEPQPQLIAILQKNCNLADEVATEAARAALRATAEPQPVGGAGQSVASTVRAPEVQPLAAGQSVVASTVQAPQVQPLATGDPDLLQATIRLLDVSKAVDVWTGGASEFLKQNAEKFGVHSGFIKRKQGRDFDMVVRGPRAAVEACVAFAQNDVHWTLESVTKDTHPIMPDHREVRILPRKPGAKAGQHLPPDPPSSRSSRSRGSSIGSSDIDEFSN